MDANDDFVDCLWQTLDYAQECIVVTNAFLDTIPPSTFSSDIQRARALPKPERSQALLEVVRAYMEQTDRFAQQFEQTVLLIIHAVHATVVSYQRLVAFKRLLRMHRDEVMPALKAVEMAIQNVTNLHDELQSLIPTLTRPLTKTGGIPKVNARLVVGIHSFSKQLVREQEMFNTCHAQAMRILVVTPSA